MNVRVEGKEEEKQNEYITEMKTKIRRKENTTNNIVMEKRERI